MKTAVKDQVKVAKPRRRSLFDMLNDLPRKNQTTPGIRPLPTPDRLQQEHPLSREAAQKVLDTRQQIIDILEGKDKRMLAVVGPCSEDDSMQPDGTPSVVKYAQELQDWVDEQGLSEKLLVIMRCPPAKPRSELGMAGLEQKDAVAAHKLLADIANLGMPLALEVMGPEHIARYGYLISLPWVGARNNKDTILRHALSAHPEFPVLIKNDEYGELPSALQAVKTINESHENARVTLPDGRAGYMHKTEGNPHTGIIWRGGSHYMTPEKFEEGLIQTANTGMSYAVDCAHGGEQAHDAEGKKSVAAQKICFDHVLELIASKKLLAKPKAIMIESNLLEGNDTTRQTPGKSWTDPCVNLADTKAMLLRLSEVASK